MYFLCCFFQSCLLVSLFPKEDEKEVGELGGCGRGEELGENEGEETVIRIYCMRNLIFNKNIFMQVKKYFNQAKFSERRDQR